MPDVLVVGSGHNGLIAACCLARAGLDVLVRTQSRKPGGGARTDQTVPGYRFDTRSVARTIVNMTESVFELKAWVGRTAAENARADDRHGREAAPGFRATIRGVAVRTPERMAAELRWPGAHPMTLDATLDQLGWMRPTKALGGHATPVRGLFICGAGTGPGSRGHRGRAAARALLDRHGPRRRPGSLWRF
ncbi:MAG: NAD(P)-binding protein [Egibacteraceae bacterium]